MTRSSLLQAHSAEQGARICRMVDQFGWENPSSSSPNDSLNDILKTQDSKYLEKLTLNASGTDVIEARLEDLESGMILVKPND